MGLKSQRAIIWSLICAGPVLGLSFWLLAGFLPIPAPSMAADEVAAMYQQNATNIRTTVMLWVMLIMLWLPFSAVVSAQMSRAESGFPVWASTQFGGGAILVLLAIFMALFWGVASYRLERHAEVIMALNDYGFFLLVMAIGPLGFQILSVGISALIDRSQRPIFPRWFGFMSLWVFILTLPGLLIIFFKAGPFAWNGLLAFWLQASVVVLWAAFLIPLLLRGISIQSEAHHQ